MTAVTESKFKTIEWNGYPIRYAIYPDGNDINTQRIYLYEDIFRASGSSILNNFFFKDVNPQFFDGKGNHLIGLVNEVVAAISEIQEPEWDKEFRAALDEFTTYVKKLHAAESTSTDKGKELINEIVAAIEAGPGSKESEELAKKIFTAGRGSKSNSAIIFIAYAMGEAQKLVGKEKFEQFAINLTQLNNGK